MLQFKKEIIKTSKPFSSVLTSFKGIGFYLANLVCFSCGILPKTPSNQLTRAQLNDVLNWVEVNLSDRYLFENNLSVKEAQGKKLHVKIKSYKGSRYSFSLPANGQRTKTNAKTAKRLQSKL